MTKTGAPPNGPAPRRGARTISLTGAALSLASLIGNADGRPLWALITAGAAMLAWVILFLFPTWPPAPIRIGFLAIMVTGGTAAAPATSGLSLAAAMLSIVIAFGMPELSPLVGSALTGIGAVCIAVSALIGSGTDTLLIGTSALIFAVIIGLSRRQTRLSAEREKRTAAELLEAQRALAASAAQEERARIARDLHDVLAHTLGGLVLQLDALDALAEAGRTEEVITRTQTARRLAADGLRDARIAVGVLDGTRSGDLSDLVDQVHALVATEQQLGVVVSAHIPRLTGTASPAFIDAFREAVREALTNARTHGSGTVSLSLAELEGMLTLTVRNDVPTRPGDWSRTGSGRGLRGMRERFAHLVDGHIEVEAADGSFTLSATARIA